MSLSQPSQGRWQPWLLTLMAVALVAAAVFYTRYAISIRPAPQKFSAPPSVPLVTVESLTATAARSLIEGYGEVRSREQVTLRAQVDGEVIQRATAFRQGQRITQGDLLLALDATHLDTALAEARRALADAQLAQQLEQREHEQAQRNWRLSGLKQAPGALVLREPQLAAARARLRAAQAMVAQAERDRALSRITAPFDAVVLAPTVATGSLVQRGDALATLQGSARAEVPISLSAQQWQQLPAQLAGLEAVLSSAQQPGARWLGTVTLLAAAINSNNRQRQLLIEIEQPLDQVPALLPGSFVKVQLQGRYQPDLFVIPARAFTASGYLWWVDNGQLRRHRTTPLFSQDDRHFIPRADLPASLDLVQRPMASYLPGMKVSTRPAEVTP